MRSEGVEDSKINWIRLGEGSNLSKVILDGVEAVDAHDSGTVPMIALRNRDGSIEYVRYSNIVNRDLELRQLIAVLKRNQEGEKNDV